MDSAGNQWEQVTFTKKHTTGSAAGKTAAARSGNLASVSKFGAGSQGKAGAVTGNKSARKLDEATGEEGFKHDKVDKSFSKALQQARLAKKMNQKDLATKINEKPQVITQYESGKAIPNPQVIQKLSRALGCQLPRAVAKKKK